MDRNRDSRRINNVSSSSRRRSRGSFREPSGVSEVEDGANETHDSSARLRDRSSNGGKKDRSNRRRRLNSNDGYHIDRDEIAEGSSEESMYEDHEEEDEPVRGANLRRTSSSTVTTTANRIKPPWKASDEIIGVPVPRKARSACAKRSHESSPSVFGMGGGSSSFMLADGLMHHPSSLSPVRTSAASASPPSPSASMRAGKRVKPITMKNKPPKTAKVSISESEVEVARFLYGLTRLQAQPSPSNQENFQTSSPKHDSKQHSSNEGSVSGASKATSPVSPPVSPRASSQPSLLQHSSSSPAVVMAPKRKKPRPVKLEDSSSNTMLACSSIATGVSSISNSVSPNGAASATKIDADTDSQATKMEVLSPRSEKNAPPADGVSCKLEPSLHMSSPLQTTSQRDIPTDEKVSTPSPKDSKPLPSVEEKQHPTATSARTDNRSYDADCQTSIDQSSTLKQLSPGRELVATSGPDSRLEDKKFTSSVSAVNEGLNGDKFKIDLMALPTNSSLENDGVLETTEKNDVQTPNHKPSPVFEEIASSDKEMGGQAVKMETEEKVGSGFNVTDTKEETQTKETTEKIDLEKQFVDERNSGPHHDENRSDKASNKHQSQKPKSVARQTERTVTPGGVSTSTSTPIPAALGWPGGLSPFGYMGSNPVPSLHGAAPVEGSSAVPNAPFVMVPPARPSRCATHCYIARLIQSLQQSQQQLARFNPFWAATSPANFYGAKPYNLNILPNSDARTLGGSLIKNSSPLPPNRTQSGLGSGSAVVSQNGHSTKENASSTYDGQRNQSHFSQPVQQGPSFIFPMIQSKTGGTKSGSSTDNAGLLTASSAAGSGSAATMNSNFSNIAVATSDPQYLAILHGNYPFPIPPTYRPHIGHQQQPQPAMGHGMEFVRPFYPSQLVQFQPQSLSQTQNLTQTQNPATSTGSSSSQKRLQPQHCFPTAKLPPDSREPTGNGEDGADSRTSLAQKKLPSQYFPGNPALNPNFSQNFAIMAAPMGGKQQQQQQLANDASLHMAFRGMEVTAPVQPGHSVLQSLPEMSWHHYQIPAQPFQLPDQFQNPGANQAKTTGKVTHRPSDKSPESSRSQAAVAASSQQLQKQSLARTNDSNLHMSFKGMEVTAPVPPGHSVLHGLPEFSRHHYQIPGQPLQLVDQFQIPGKTAGKVTARSSDRSPESNSRPQTPASSASASHQFQKQSLGRVNDPNFHMSMRGMDVNASPPPGHSVLQSLPELGRHHYQLPDHFQIPGANHGKPVGKVKSPESSRSQTGVASVAEQLQKQAMSRNKPASSNSSPTPTLDDRISASYSNTGMKSSAGSAGLPNIPGQQWRVPQRLSSPAGSPGNSTLSAQPPSTKGPLPGQSTGQANTGSLTGKPAKPVSSPRNSSGKSTTAGSPLLAQSGQGQNPAKTQLLQQHQGQSQQFFPSSESILQHSGGLYPKRPVMPPNQAAQAMFPHNLNQRRPAPQVQSGPALALANAGAYLGKAPAGYNSQQASNVPVKSAEQKPAAA